MVVGRSGQMQVHSSCNTNNCHRVVIAAAAAPRVCWKVSQLLRPSTKQLGMELNHFGDRADQGS